MDRAHVYCSNDQCGITKDQLGFQKITDCGVVFLRRVFCLCTVSDFVYVLRLFVIDVLIDRKMGEESKEEEQLRGRPKGGRFWKSTQTQRCSAMKQDKGGKVGQRD